jgi:hypothetical protein
MLHSVTRLALRISQNILDTGMAFLVWQILVKNRADVLENRAIPLN